MELQPLPDIAATAWHLTIKGCLLQCGLPRVNLLEASLAVKEPQVTCPIVSRRLCDPIEGVANRASRPLNRQALWNLRTYRASESPMFGFD